MNGFIETPIKRTIERPTVSASSLNYAQERELYRLIDYERKTCSADGDLVYHCAFPYRPDNDLQAELIESGHLSIKSNRTHGSVVMISSEGYSYFPELAREERERKARERRDARLIAITALFTCLGMVIGFLAGFLLR